MEMPAYKDPDHEGNGKRYRTGKRCVGHPRGYKCDGSAGTKWSPHWCFDCNVKRIDSNYTFQVNLRLRCDRRPAICFSVTQSTVSFASAAIQRVRLRASYWSRKGRSNRRAKKCNRSAVLRAVRQFAWLEVDSVKVALPICSKV